MPPCRASSMIATPTNIDMSALSAQLSPRDETFGADPNTNNILIALGVVLALAFICILVNLGLIRWGDRSLFARLPCCTSRLSIFDEDDDEPILRKAKIRRIPRIHDIALASHPSSPKDDRNLTWKHLMVRVFPDTIMETVHRVVPLASVCTISASFQPQAIIVPAEACTVFHPYSFSYHAGVSLLFSTNTRSPTCIHPSCGSHRDAKRSQLLQYSML